MFAFFSGKTLLAPSCKFANKCSGFPLLPGNTAPDPNNFLPAPRTRSPNPEQPDPEPGDSDPEHISEQVSGQRRFNPNKLTPAGTASIKKPPHEAGAVWEKTR